MNKNFGEKNTGKYKIIISSVLIGLTVTALLILIFSVIMFATEMNKDYAVILATASVAAGSFAAAFYAAKTVQSKGFMVGLIVGGITFLAVTLISLIIDKGALSMNTLFHFIIFMLSSLIGGIMGVNKAANKKYI